MMDVRQIRTEADYGWTLKEVERYFENEPAPGSAEADRFDVLYTLIEAYEAKRWPIEAPDPASAIREAMQARQLKLVDFGRLIGSKSRASEILRGRRSLTMEQAFTLYKEWHIPAEVLLRPPAK